MNITKELFLESIEALKAQSEHDKKCSEAFEVILPHDHVSLYDNDRVVGQLVKILKVLTEDSHPNFDDGSPGWIDYYIYDLEFGEKYRPGSVSVAGEDYELKTPEDLWNLLNE